MDTFSMKMKIWAILIMVSCCAYEASSRPLRRSETQRVEEFIYQVMRCARIPALNLALVRDGEVVYSQGFGTANYTTSSRADADTIFCVGSCTQSFTSTLLAQLLSENGNYTWDTPVRDILGDWFLISDRYRSKHITLRDILSHRTGISNLDAIMMSDSMDRDTLLKKLRYVPGSAGFREKFRFNNILFSVVQAIIEKLGNDTWENLMRERILAPLNMRQSVFIHEEEGKHNFASPIMKFNASFKPLSLEAYRGYKIAAASNTLCSSASDIAKWLLFHLHGGKDMAGRTVMEKDLLEATYQATMNRGDSDRAGSEGFLQPDIQVSYTQGGYGMGWIRGYYRGYPLISHGGNLPGYQSYMTLLPVRRVGASTSFVGESGAKAYAAKILINIFALDILLNGQPWVADGDICSTMEKMVRLSRQYPLNVPPYKKSFASRGHLLNYEGAFENMIFGSVMVATNYSSGLLHLHYGQANYVLQPTNENHTFIMEAAPGPLWFETHADEYTRRGPVYAIFNRTRDDSARMNTIKLPSFDKDIEPIFLRKSSNPILDALAPSAAASEYEDLEDDVDEKVDDFYCSSDSPRLMSFLSAILAALSLYIIM